MNENLIVSYAPHIRGKDNVQHTMLDVIIALMPALLGAIYFFGIRSLYITLTGVASSVFFEYLWCKLAKKDVTTGDLSAAVTGILISYSVPPTIPLYMVVIASAFAIIIVKCCFGGLGQNIVNPALAARAFMRASWPVEMTNYTAPFDKLGLFASVASSTQTPTSGATPLAFLKGVEGASAASYTDLFFGHVGGCVGEVSAFLLIIGGIYLVARRVINLTIPLTYILSVGVFGFIFGGKTLFPGDFLYNILAGGVIMAGIFMATDYTTSPVSKRGQFIFALGAGFITGVIRVFGGYPEGVTYAIMLMNITVPLIDKHIMPRTFGYGREAAK